MLLYIIEKLDINQTYQLLSLALKSSQTRSIKTELAPSNPGMRGCGNYGLLPNSNHGRIGAKKDTRAKERAVNAITNELVYTACCRLVNYYNCEVPAIFRLALVHQRYIPIPTCRHCPAILNSADSQ